MVLPETSLAVEAHPRLDLGTIIVTFDRPLAALGSPAWLSELLRADAPGATLASTDEVRARIRDLLRAGGYKPTGRGKPASEYLLKAASDGSLTSINVAVDLGNAVSLHSGLPISVVDLDRVEPPLGVGLAAAGASYVFNSAAQTIDLEGLLCLHDASGPCANAVKDSMRSKTRDETTRVLVLVWGSRDLEGRSAHATRWLGELAERAGARAEAPRLR